ncbi:MAG: hypothetical protein KAJ52_00545 [Sedimentisphaerales bacterium]|nr:hypothetical protein [Sedimentisphaerales bacterium]
MRRKEMVRNEDKKRPFVDRSIVKKSALSPFLVWILVCSAVVSWAADEPETKDNKSAPTETAKAKATDVEWMKAAIIKKNIFKPERVPPLLSRETGPELLMREIWPMSLDRPFRVIACDTINDIPQVYLQFDNPPVVRSYKVKDVIQFTVTILEIKPTFIRCKYENKKVRIDKGETSDDALLRLRGFDGRDYEFKGTTVTDDVAFVFFQIDGLAGLVRAEVGDWLGQDQIVAIEPGMVTVRLENGEELYIP